MYYYIDKLQQECYVISWAIIVDVLSFMQRVCQSATYCSHTPVNAHSHIAFKDHVTLDSYLGSAAVCTKIGVNEVLCYKMCMVLYLIQNSL